MTRAEILRDARKRYADGLRLNMGWTWGHCLRVAHEAAKLRKVFAEQQKAMRERIEANGTGL